MSKYSMEQLGERIAAARRARRMTQDELACRLAITPQAVSKWETGAGLPDVTLFPAIAEALGLSIGELFGEAPASQEGETVEFPTQHQGMTLVGQDGAVGCYSDKEVDRTDGQLIRFSDGSEANLLEQSVLNCGQGEVRFLRLDQTVGARGKSKHTLWEESYSPFQSLNLNIAYSQHVQVNVLPGKSGEYRVHAEGSEHFVSLIESKKQGDELILAVKSNDGRDFSHGQNTLTVYTGDTVGRRLQIAIGGSSDVDIQPPFDEGHISVNGSGDVRASCFESLEVRVNGSSEIKVKDVSQTANIQINGSGDVRADNLGRTVHVNINGAGEVIANTAGDTILRIAGSGDITLKKISGRMSAVIAGSGEIKCGGEIEQLSLNVGGSGDFDCPELVVGEANIVTKATATITLGRIVRRSVEKLSENTTMRVGKRG